MARRAATPPPAAATPGPAWGHRGGRILPHRAIGRLPLPWQRLAGGGALALLLTAALLLAKPWLETAWSEALTAWLQALNLGATVVPAGQVEPNGQALPLTLAVPLVELPLPPLGWTTLALHAVAMLALWVASGGLPDALRPLAYLLRFGALVHAVALGYFALWPASFQHSVADHLGNGLRQAWALMLLTPWMHLFTYYLFPLRAWQRLALSAVTLAYLALLAPLLVATHAVLLWWLGPVVMPLLQLLLGALLAIVGMVALYAWGMSWVDPAKAAEA